MRLGSGLQLCYDLGKEGTHQTGLSVERKILGQKDKRAQQISGGNSEASTDAVISFAYTTVQYDVVIKNDGSATVKKVSPPTVQRPKK